MQDQRFDIFNKTETTHLIPGPVGLLEVLSASPQLLTSDTVAIICHPNPVQEGTMHNKVVTTLHKVFLARGMRTVRFNFRGVGMSEGGFDRGIGETEDVLAVQAWLQQTADVKEFAFAGFSFGGAVAIKAAAQSDPVCLVTVAPSVKLVDLSAVDPIICPWVLAHGEADEVVLLQDVKAWLQLRREQPMLMTFPETGHFFHRKLVDLRDRLLEQLPAC